MVKWLCSTVLQCLGMGKPASAGVESWPSLLVPRLRERKVKTQKHYAQQDSKVSDWGKREVRYHE